MYFVNKPRSAHIKNSHSDYSDSSSTKYTSSCCGRGCSGCTKFWGEQKKSIGY